MKPAFFVIFTLALAHSALGDCNNYILHFPDYSCVQQEPLNSGSNGTAYIVSLDGAEYILKVQPRNWRSQNEIAALQKLAHVPYVVKLIQLKQLAEDSLMIISYGKKGNLEVFLEQRGSVDFAFVVDFFRKVMEALSQIHDAGLVHADLKFENVVVDEQDQPMIIDFDLVVGRDSLASPRGTLDYMAPEVLRKFVLGQVVQFTPEVDLYSVGVMFYEMAMQAKPYELDRIDYNMLLNRLIIFPSKTPLALYEFCSSSIMVRSKRTDFASAFRSLMDDGRMQSQETLPTVKIYSLIQFAGPGEEPVEGPELDALTVLIIVGVGFVLMGGFVIYLLIHCCCTRAKGQAQHPLVQHVEGFQMQQSTAPGKTWN